MTAANPPETFRVRCGRCRRVLARGRDRDGLVASGATDDGLLRHAFMFDGSTAPAQARRGPTLLLNETKGTVVASWTNPETGEVSLSLTCRCGIDHRVRYERLVALYRDVRTGGGGDVLIVP